MIIKTKPLAHHKKIIPSIPSSLLHPGMRCQSFLTHAMNSLLTLSEVDFAMLNISFKLI